MKRIKGLRKAQQDYNWIISMGYDYCFLFNPWTGKLWCDYSVSNYTDYSLVEEENRLLGWVYLDDLYNWRAKRAEFKKTKGRYWGHQADFWAEYRKNWGNRALFKEVKRLIGEKWPEYKDEEKGKMARN